VPVFKTGAIAVLPALRGKNSSKTRSFRATDPIDHTIKRDCCSNLLAIFPHHHNGLEQLWPRIYGKKGGSSTPSTIKRKKIPPEAGAKGGM